MRRSWLLLAFAVALVMWLWRSPREEVSDNQTHTNGRAPEPGYVATGAVLFETDADGRVRELTQDTLDAGDYRLIFATQRYFERSGLSAFYPEVSVVFTIEDPGDLHVPLLLSPFGYTTYKGV